MLLALLASAPMRVSAQTVTVDTVGDALRIHAPGFSFLKGEPLARLKDGRSVRVELVAAVLSGAGEVGRGHDAADLRVELRSLGGTIRRDRCRCAFPVGFAPDGWPPPRPGASSSWPFP